MRTNRDLTNSQWAILDPLIPEPSRRDDRRGRPWKDRRAVLDGILWVLRTGARGGASVIVNYSSSPQKAEEVVGRIKANGGSTKAVRADVSKPAEARQLIDATLAEFGRVDILVNNAGVYEFRPLPEVDEAHFDRMFDLNVKGLVFATQAAVKAFGENGGTVINISSMASLAATPNGSVYSATKAAVDSVTRLAEELGPKKILVNSVLPGPVETDGALSLSNWDEFSDGLVQQTPPGRVGKPADIAKVVSFLASDDAGWITGQVIPVAGGLRA